MKDYCIQQAKPQLDANWPKSPPPLLPLVRYSACIRSHDITLPNCISCIIEHFIGDLAEESPQGQTGNFFRLDLSISCNFQPLWLRWQKVPPTPSSQTGKYFRLDLSISCNYQQLCSAGRKDPLSFAFS